MGVEKVVGVGKKGRGTTYPWKQKLLYSVQSLKSAKWVCSSAIYTMKEVSEIIVVRSGEFRG